MLIQWVDESCDVPPHIAGPVLGHVIEVWRMIKWPCMWAVLPTTADQ